jgi:small subunit ribosomal protein S1
MADIPGGQLTSVRNDAWWKSPGEDYWRAVMEQGEMVPEPVSPADPQEILYPFLVESGLDESASSTAVAGADLLSGEVWDQARLAHHRGDVFSLRVAGANRGGLLVDWNGLQGFVPASHLKEMPRTRDPYDRASELSHREGETLALRLIEVDEPQSRLVFTERAVGSDAAAPAALLHSLHPGDTCRGRVINLTSFGAFVDLGGVEGLIHISEISWDRLRHPSDVLRPGEEVEVHVLGVSPEEGRIALSLKRLRPNPWSHVESRYQVGQVVEGIVTNVVSFGAFVRLEEGLEGLIHVSELSDGSFVHPRSVVREGDRVRVRVLNTDTHKQRLGLSLRQAHEPDRRG